MKQYRIGDFAKYLGVTPDFLKHYEDLGLIHSRRSENGYRYFPFYETMFLIECVRLRNYGMTLREIKEILTLHEVESEQVDRRLAENMGHLREEARLDEAITEQYAAFLAWREPLLTRDFDWEIRRSKPALFLPHSDGQDFLHDERIYELLGDWMSYIPIVTSCMKADEDGKITWGFSMDERWAETLHLPRNDVVEPIPARRVFYYKFRGPLPSMADETGGGRHPALEKVAGLGLRRSGSYYRVTVMPADWKKDIRNQYGFYAIPLADD